MKRHAGAAASAAVGLAAVVGAALLWTQSSTAAPQRLPDMPPFSQSTVLLSPASGSGVEVAVYVADTADERRQGLRNVDHLPEDAGMLFVWDTDVSCCFTMENTRIPLSLAVAGAGGTVRATLDMEPCGDRRPCPTYDPGVEYRSALEVNQGFFDRIGLVRGWHMRELTPLRDLVERQPSWWQRRAPAR